MKTKTVLACVVLVGTTLLGAASCARQEGVIGPQSATPPSSTTATTSATEASGADAGVARDAAP